MARIGNWLTTWEREVKEQDFTSILIPYSLRKSIISKEDVTSSRIEDLIVKIKNSDARKEILKEWENLYKEADKKGKRISSIDNDFILGKFEYLLTMHFITENLK